MPLFFFLELLFLRLLDDLDLLEFPEDRFTFEELLDLLPEDLTREEDLDLETFPLLLDEEEDRLTPELLLEDPEDLLTLDPLFLFDPELRDTEPDDLLPELLDLIFPDRPLFVVDPLERTLELPDLPLFVTLDDLPLLLTLDELRVLFTLPELLLDMEEDPDLRFVYLVLEPLLSYFCVKPLLRAPYE